MGWDAGVARLAASENGMVLAARRGVATIEDLTLRPFRRPNSQLAR